MKYFFISLIVTVLIGVISYFLGITNNKSDRVFLMIFGSLLLIIGSYFSFRFEKVKDEDSQIQSKKLDTTLLNTENLKSKADSIIINLNESLEKTLSLSDSINNQNKSLSNIENNVKQQIINLEKTLAQTKIFEKRIKEQLELDKKRFETEKPEVEVVVNFINSKQKSKYKLYLDFRNSGKRTAKDISFKGIIIFFKDDDASIEHFTINNSTQSRDELPADNKVQLTVRSYQDYELLNYSMAIFALKYSYFDVLLDKSIEKIVYLDWFGMKKSVLNLHTSQTENIEKITQYITEKNIDF